MSFYRKYEKAILASTKASEIESSRPRFIQVFCFHTSSRCFVLTCRPGVLFSHAVKLFVTRRYFHHYYLQLEKGRRNTELLHSPLSQKHERPINPPVHVFCSNQSYMVQPSLRCVGCTHFILTKYLMYEYNINSVVLIFFQFLVMDTVTRVDVNGRYI